MRGSYCAAIFLSTASAAGSVVCESGQSRRSLPSRSVHERQQGCSLLVSLEELLSSSTCVVVCAVRVVSPLEDIMSSERIRFLTTPFALGNRLTEPGPCAVKPGMGEIKVPLGFMREGS